jgi:LacI family transcriptional regulator
VQKKPGLRTVTILDVARHAKVSTATVSRALTGSRPMSDELRDRVKESARELGYQVNLVGRALRQQRTSTLGLVIPDLENPFFSSLAQRVSRRFGQTQVDVLVASADNDILTERRAVESFLGRQVDAIVVIPSDELDSRKAVGMASEYVPTIQFDRFVPGLAVPFVGVDNAIGMGHVIDHLEREVDTERFPVVFLGGGQSSSSGRERTVTVTGALPDAWVLDGGFSFDWGQQAARKVLESGLKRGTLVAAADIIALGAMSFIVTSGFRVPDDFRIIGFDDVGVSHLAFPTLTTVRQPITDMTNEIHSLVQRGTTDGSLKATSALFAPEWVMRQSSPGAN